MDVGPFVAALEYATETEAIIIGKPNRAYFQMALEDLNMPPSKVAMVGDDIYTDILGGDSVGTHTILVRTGKSQYDDLSKAEVKPDRTIKSIAELPEILTTR
ncbi:HAD-IA family hydrolase [candidate division KSB1 bacterium]|nr:HAD-IA family hydrolase [candidate division KSB1 bacterium]